jgi:hypothetical protein
MRQMSLHFESGIAQRNRSLRDHLTTQVYQRGLVKTAGDLDIAPSKLTEKLAGASTDGKVRGLSIDEFERYLDKTGDLSPIYYLVDKYLHDPGIAQQEALAKLAAIGAALPGLLAAAGVGPAETPARKRR